MPSIAVEIQPEVLNWALKQAKEEHIDDALINNIHQWLDGTKVPTYNRHKHYQLANNN